MDSAPSWTDDRIRGSELCTQCGLCCTGALHDRALLEEDELGTAAGLGLPVSNEPKPGFSLQCPKLAGTVCTIYPDRPRVCGRYRCGLLQRLEAGDIAFPEALEVVTTARALVDALRSLMPAGMTLPQARAVARKPAEDVGREDMPLRLAATTLMYYTNGNFRKPDEESWLTLSPLQASVEMDSDEPDRLHKI